MSKNHHRALRRHHLARLKTKRLKFYGGYINTLPPEAQQRHLGRLAHTAKLCSCPLCGNPRKHWQEPTRQETLLTLKAFCEQLQEVQNRAAALGVFTDTRELFNCTSCGLQEDVLFDGRLVTYFSHSDDMRDCGLRFIEAENGQFLCPQCGEHLTMPTEN